MSNETSRREFLGLLWLIAGVGSNANAHGSSGRGAVGGTGEEDAAISGVFDEIIREPTRDQLPRPRDPPAYAVTNEGAWEFPEGGDGWQRVPLGTGGDPIPETSHFESVRAGELASDLPPNRAGESGYTPGVRAEKRNLENVSTRRPGEPVIAWIFDDVRESIYRNQDVWHDNGVEPILAPAVDFASGEKPTDFDEMNWDQIEEMVDEHDWGIVNHSKSHTRYENLTEDEQIEDMYASNREFHERGFQPSAFVWPFGSYTDHARSIANELYPYAFHVSDASQYTQEDPLTLNRYSTDHNAIADIESRIDDAVRQSRPLALMGHEAIRGDESDEDPDGYETSTEKIRAVIDYATNNGARFTADLREYFSYLGFAYWEHPGGVTETIRPDGRHYVDLPQDGRTVIRDHGANRVLQVRNAGSEGQNRVDLFGDADLDGNELNGGGASNKLDLRDLYTLPPQDSEPDTDGANVEVAVQDGTNWDPAGTGQEEIVAFLNGSWTKLS